MTGKDNSGRLEKRRQDCDRDGGRDKLHRRRLGEDAASSGCNVESVRQLDGSRVEQKEPKVQLNTSGQRCDSSHGIARYKHAGWTLPGDGAALYRLNTNHNSQGRHEAGHVTDV